ncbi:MAG: stage II sporulation protein P [Oscillospiraceae bacterium]|nr:stage II sporulation protein P [Oscillospiraceae bacterium]
MVISKKGLENFFALFFSFLTLILMLFFAIIRVASKFNVLKLDFLGVISSRLVFFKSTFNKQPFEDLHETEADLDDETLTEKYVEKQETKNNSLGQKSKITEIKYSANGTRFENFYFKNTTGREVEIKDYLSRKLNLKTPKKGEPAVLIYHTHTTESYNSCDSEYFDETFYPRSQNPSENVVAVGKEIAKALEECGIKTIHETTIHDLPSYTGSYSRSAETVKANVKKYPTIKIVLDIHRDSILDGANGKIKPVFTINGQKAAQIMIICGCGASSKSPYPNWEKNLTLALHLQRQCENLFPGVTRALLHSNVKYNQDLTPGSLLIEVGSDVNTPEEAKRSGAMVGKAVSSLFSKA